MKIIQRQQGLSRAEKKNDLNSKKREIEWVLK